MGRLKYIFFPFILAAMLAQPLTQAAGVTLADSACYEAGAPPCDNCERDKQKRPHGKGFDDGAALRVYSMITGKTVEELKNACDTGKLTIWELARRDGRLDTLKTKLLEGNTAALDALVKSGIITSEHKTKILEHIRDELGKR